MPGQGSLKRKSASSLPELLGTAQDATIDFTVAMASTSLGYTNPKQSPVAECRVGALPPDSTPRSARALWTVQFYDDWKAGVP